MLLPVASAFLSSCTKNAEEIEEVVTLNEEAELTVEAKHFQSPDKELLISLFVKFIHLNLC